MAYLSLSARSILNIQQSVRPLSIACGDEGAEGNNVVLASDTRTDFKWLWLQHYRMAIFRKHLGGHKET